LIDVLAAAKQAKQAKPTARQTPKPADLAALADRVYGARQAGKGT
jgi:hypothetical protein